MNVQVVLKHRIIQYIAKMRRRHYYLQKKKMFNTQILRKKYWFQEKY